MKQGVPTRTPLAGLAPLHSKQLPNKLKKLPKPGARRGTLDRDIDALLNVPTSGKRNSKLSFEEEEGRRFKELQASFKNAMSKPVLDLASRAKHTYIGELKTSAGSVGALPQGLSKVGSKFDVLPAITAKPDTPKSKVVSPDANTEYCPRSVEEVEKMMPPEYAELKQMMELHTDLKSQMSANRAKLQEIKDTEGEDCDVLKLLREQAAHVVAMMKDVLERLESYPEELWALYGTMEAYEACLADEGNKSSNAMELYSQLLVHIQEFIGTSQ